MTELSKYPSLTQWIKTYSGRHLHAGMYADKRTATLSCSALSDLDRLIQSCPENDAEGIMRELKTHAANISGISGVRCDWPPETD